MAGFGSQAHLEERYLEDRAKCHIRRKHATLSTLNKPATPAQKDTR
jgi:hypothetical protein